LGDRWLALDYYLTTSHLYCLSVTANECTIETRPLTASFHFALEQCTKTAKNGRWPTTVDLAQLGHWLLPATLGARITPATSILIAPHRQLHQVPWAALIEPTSQQPLMECGIPGSVLSLHSLQQLWLRPCPSEPRRPIGLAIGVSDFGLHRAALPQVTVEIEQLLALWEPGSRQLLDEKATWANWQALRNEPEWPSFRFLHIASHASHDASTGRLSGIALHDQDLWLDQLEQLAPLPELITLSACSGTQALIYEGDELIGLPTTCLAAGAQHVVGSLWPVLDEDAAELMQDFYRHVVAGEDPATALALAQRAAHRKKAGMAHWGSFGCEGAA
jgi:CHAT domain-containing protein